MMVRALQSYVNLVNGLSKASRDRTRATASDLLSQAGLDEAAKDAGERFTQLVEELVNAGRANRELVESLVSAEVTRVVRGLGFVRSDDLDELREEIAELRHQFDRHRRASDSADAPKTPTGAAPGRATSAANHDDAAPQSGPGRTGGSTSATAGRTKSSRRRGPAPDPGPEAPPPGVSPEAAVNSTGPGRAASKRPTAGQAAAGRSSRTGRTPRGTAPGSATSGGDGASPATGGPGAAAADEQDLPIAGGADAGA